MKSCSFLGILSSVFIFGAWDGSPSLYADWLALQDGEHLRGVDLKKWGTGFQFTLETGETIFLTSDEVFHVEKSPRSEKVEFRKKKVPLGDKIRVLQKERQTRAVETVKNIEFWASQNTAREEIQQELATLSPSERVEFTALALRHARESAARRLAARELASEKDQSARQMRASIYSLARAALVDSDVRVRKTCRAYLLALRHPETVPSLSHALSSHSSLVRSRAAAILASFGDARAVKPLVETLHLAMGMGDVSQRKDDVKGTGRQRRNSSKGTVGISIAELSGTRARSGAGADVVGPDRSGVELRQRLTALKALTGQDFGRDIAAWQAWLETWLAKNDPRP